MPSNTNWVKLIFDDQTLRLAAAIAKSPSVKRYIEGQILNLARRQVEEFKAQAVHAGLETPVQVPQPEGQ